MTKDQTKTTGNIWPGSLGWAKKRQRETRWREWIPTHLKNRLLNDPAHILFPLWDVGVGLVQIRRER